MKNILKNKKVRRIFFAGAQIVILALIIFWLSAKKISDVEEMLIDEISSELFPYIDEVYNDSTDNIEKYMIFGLKYNLNTNSKNTISSTNLRKIINSKLNVKVSKEEISNHGVSPKMLEYNINYDVEADTYTIDSSTKTNYEIANETIYGYIKTSQKKKTMNKFIVNYEIYAIDNPYEILNYYNNLNSEIYLSNLEENNDDQKAKDNSKTNTKEYDVEPILNYLTGKASIADIQSYLAENVLNEIGENKGNIQVVYELVDGSLLIDSIEKI